MVLWSTRHGAWWCSIVAVYGALGEKKQKTLYPINLDLLVVLTGWITAILYWLTAQFVSLIKLNYTY
jgi:hypothetical protein